VREGVVARSSGTWSPAKDLAAIADDFDGGQVVCRVQAPRRGRKTRIVLGPLFAQAK
jgi:hypothetical protein